MTVNHVLRRLRMEVALLFAQLPIIAAAVAYLAYFGYMLFRNLAFYRFVPGERLHDLGHDLIPSLGPTLHVVGELPMVALYLLITALSLATFIPPPTNSAPKPYFINMFRRFVCVLGAGHTLRFVSYIGTSLPGAADHCMPGMVEAITPVKPTTAHEIFTRYAATPGSNCGDLIFSGHMLQAILFGCVIARYSQRCFSLSNFGAMLLRGATFLLVGCQAFFIIAARNHYTVDVVVASYTAPLLWYFYCTAVHPEDLSPEEAALPAFATALTSKRRSPERGLVLPKHRTLLSQDSANSGCSGSGGGSDADIERLLPADWDTGYGP